MCTAVDRVFPGYRINRLRALLRKISQARAAGRSRRARQTPVRVREASATRVRRAHQTPVHGARASPALLVPCGAARAAIPLARRRCGGRALYEWATIRPEQPDASQRTAGSATPNLRVGRPNIVRIWHARLGSHKRNQADLANLP